MSQPSAGRKGHKISTQVCEVLPHRERGSSWPSLQIHSTRCNWVFSYICTTSFRLRGAEKQPWKARANFSGSCWTHKSRRAQSPTSFCEQPRLSSKISKSNNSYFGSQHMIPFGKVSRAHNTSKSSSNMLISLLIDVKKFSLNIISNRFHDATVVLVVIKLIVKVWYLYQFLFTLWVISIQLIIFPMEVEMFIWKYTYMYIKY